MTETEVPFPEKGSSSIVRTTHLGGGLRCSIELTASRIDVWPLPNNSSVQIDLEEMTEFVCALEARGIEVIGIEESVAFPHRRFTTLWQVSPHIFGEVDIERNPVSFWSGIKAAAREASNWKLDALSSSIAFSLTAMERHLLFLSNEYHRELRSALERGTKPKDRFASIETYDLWLAIHAFLLAAGSARDYLAQALVEFVFRDEISKIISDNRKERKPDSMSILLKKGKEYGFLGEKLIGILLMEANEKTDRTAWMANMSEFRNLITHRAPITQISKNNRLELIHTGSFGEHDILQIVLPLPKEPRCIERSSLVDALALMRYYNERMADLSLEVGRLMPCPPKSIALNENEIISIEPL